MIILRKYIAFHITSDMSDLFLNARLSNDIKTKIIFINCISKLIYKNI